MICVGLLCVILAFPMSYPFAFCVGSLFYGVVVSALPNLAINLLGCFTLF